MVISWNLKKARQTGDTLSLRMAGQIEQSQSVIVVSWQLRNARLYLSKMNLNLWEWTLASESVLSADKKREIEILKILRVKRNGAVTDRYAFNSLISLVRAEIFVRIRAASFYLNWRNFEASLLFQRHSCWPWKNQSAFAFQLNYFSGKFILRISKRSFHLARFQKSRSVPVIGRSTERENDHRAHRLKIGRFKWSPYLFRLWNIG